MSLVPSNILKILRSRITRSAPQSFKAIKTKKVNGLIKTTKYSIIFASPSCNPFRQESEYTHQKRTMQIPNKNLKDNHFRY